MRGRAVVLTLLFLLSACSRHTPPVGKWEGTYDTAETMVAARVEIDSAGAIRISAPNAEGIGDKEDARAAMRDTLATGLATGWDEVTPRVMEFDGHTFRKPRGIAPQMFWSDPQKKMVLVVYIGKQPAIHIPMRGVDDFSENPWPQ
ncbi:MAG TPA: hypothetical protein VHL34_21135 [Rhizomicrobium sp.]|nr:hypothetical protein [Rhizomicrobium sp.]